jgi:hypothetical protein
LSFRHQDRVDKLDRAGIQQVGGGCCQNLPIRRSTLGLTHPNPCKAPTFPGLRDVTIESGTASIPEKPIPSASDTSAFRGACDCRGFLKRGKLNDQSYY